MFPAQCGFFARTACRVQTYRPQRGLNFVQAHGFQASLRFTWTTLSDDVIKLLSVNECFMDSQDV